MSLAVGERIGRYEILAPLGFGGMGEVYYARDPQLERPVAIKVLTASRDATSLQLERFQREARAIARITHAHICTIHDVGEVDGVPFLVMELLDGETLAEHLERGPLPMDRALIAAGQIADALDAAHKKGVVHRDLKPGNVMLTASGVKLLDFGLAKLRDAEGADAIGLSTMSLRLTEQGTILGTVPYMSPEQVEGRELDARTDIFSLGAILYEMTSGRPAFEGRSAASLISAILTQDPKPLSSVLPDVPPGVDRVLKKCLAKDPDERWQSAADLTAALLWIRDDSSAHRDIPLANRRHRHSWTALVTALTSGAAAGSMAMWMLASPGDPTRASAPISEFIPLTFRTGSVSAARFAPDGETVIYSAAWGGEDYALFMTRRGSAESRPLGIPGAKLLGVSSTGDLVFIRGRHEAVKLLAPTSTGTLARVAMTGGAPREILDDVIAADWTPSGDLAVVRRGQVEFPLGTTIHGPHRFSYVRIAPDGQRLALVEGPDIVVLDRSGKKTMLSSGWGEMTTLAWSPSGDEVWFAAGSRRNEAWALRAVSLTGKERVVLPSPGAGIAVLDVFRDGRALISTRVGKMGCSCLPPGQVQSRELSWLDGSAPEALSADGGSLLLSELLRGAGEKGSIYLRKTDGSDAIRLGDGYGEDLSPDGKWALTTEVAGRRHWILVPTGPGSPKTLPPGPLVGRLEANFLPNGRQIVFGGREKDRGARIYLQDIDSGSIRAISPENVVTRGLATPDSRYVIGRQNGRVFKYAVDESTSIPLTYLDSDDVPLQWSSDESVLYVQRMGTWPPAVDRVNTTTGKRERWKIIQPADPSGVDSILRILITPDGKSYCHDYVRLLSELSIVEGLK
jgi:eukaryotic-like serine/threonine-protein kinase